MGSTLGGSLRVAGTVEVAARLLLAVVDAPFCWRAFRPSLGLAVVGCWVHRGCLAVLVPVAVGAGVPEFKYFQVNKS